MDTRVLAVLALLSVTISVSDIATAGPETRRPPSTSERARGQWRVTGTEVPALAGFDHTIREFMRNRGITAGALAVTYRGRLMMAHGYTRDNDRSYAIRPTSLFRIASLSKALTATAVLTLVEDDRLGLDTPIADVLDFDLSNRDRLDPRLEKVTVRHLLHHRGGWDRVELGYDPMFSDRLIADSLGVSLPVSRMDIVRFMSRAPLSHEPGTEFSYSNFGYMLLGRVIESVSNSSYERYVKRHVLRPLGMTDTHLGSSRPGNRLPGEVKYRSEYESPSVFDASENSVPRPYGAFNLENMDANGGWVSTVIDMARFLASFDASQPNPVLSHDSVRVMFEAPQGVTDEQYYAMGWRVRRSAEDGMTAWHEGTLDGTLAVMVRRSDGASWVVLLNQRNTRLDPLGAAHWRIDDRLRETADAVTTWPDHDLFAALD